MQDKTGIILKDSGNLGAVLSVFVGVHGNEKAGIYAMEEILDTINIENGKVYFVYGNPLAIEKNIRFTEKNLNRCFLKSIDGNSYEEERARFLMGILDESDALLDIHASNSEKSTPFVICEPEVFKIAAKLNCKIVSCGWDALQPGGSDGYMHQSGKVGICLECGSAQDSNNSKNILLAKNSILTFLKHFGIINNNIKKLSYTQEFIRITQVVYKKSNKFKFIRKFNDFDKLKDGEVFAKDGDNVYVAENNQIIIFPHENTLIGQEAFILAKKITAE